MNNIVRGMGFHHIALRCKDFDKSIAFYQALGCTVTESWGDSVNRAAMLDIGDGGRIELFNRGALEKTESDTQSGEWLHLALACEDPDAAFAAAVAADATVKAAPYDTVLASENPMPIRIAFVYGLDGEVLEFFHVRKDK